MLLYLNCENLLNSNEFTLLIKYLKLYILKKNILVAVLLFTCTLSASVCLHHSSLSVQGSVLRSAGGCVVAKVCCVDFCCSAAGSVVLLLPLSFPSLCLSLCLRSFLCTLFGSRGTLPNSYGVKKKAPELLSHSSHLAGLAPCFFFLDHFTQLCQQFYDDLSEVLIFVLLFTFCTSLSYSFMLPLPGGCSLWRKRGRDDGVGSD